MSDFNPIFARRVLAGPKGDTGPAGPAGPAGAQGHTSTVYFSAPAAAWGGVDETEHTLVSYTPTMVDPSKLTMEAHIRHNGQGALKFSVYNNSTKIFDTGLATSGDQHVIVTLVVIARHGATNSVEFFLKEERLAITNGTIPKTLSDGVAEFRGAVNDHIDSGLFAGTSTIYIKAYLTGSNSISYSQPSYAQIDFSS